MVLQINKNQAGLALGSLSALLHFLWVIVVALGFGQGLAEWWHKIHFIGDFHVIKPATFGTSVIGIITAFVAGYVLAWLFALLWNVIGKKLK